MRLQTGLMCLCCMVVAVPASAITQAEAEKIAHRYIAALPPADVTYEAVNTVIGDLDADGKPEIVVQKALLGPSSWSYQAEVFVARGQGYVHAGTGDLWGDVQWIAISKGVLVVKSKMPGANDPRCCTTLDKVYRYRWQNGKLIEDT